MNIDAKEYGEERLLELKELDELILDAYENVRLYKERIKLWHDRLILAKHFELGHHVLLYNSRLRLFWESLILGGLNLIL